jgi:hypothetical protein
MLDSKSIFASRTIWANIVGFACLALALLGVNTGGIDQSLFTDTLLQFFAAISFIVSTITRIVATKKLET